MYLVIIAWLYVALMMAVAEASSPIGTVLGAVFTFILYGLAPMSLAAYLMATPMRRRALRARQAAERSAAAGPEHPGSPSGTPDAGREAPADAVAPVRKEP